MKRDLFDRIAKPYGWFFSYQTQKYGHLLDRIYNELDLILYKEVVDIGCGTGAFCAELSKRGFRVTGLDSSKKMLEVARKKQSGESIRFVQGDVAEGLPFEDQSFDVSIASFVAHGLKPEARKALYREMKRVTKKIIIIYDYNQRKSILTSVMEAFEGGDYFNFAKDPHGELQKYFGSVSVIDMGDQASCYVIRI